MRTKIVVEDFIGTKIGRLFIVAQASPFIERDGRRRTGVTCRCDCGEEKVIRLSDLIYNKTLSCGCLNSENVTLRNKKGTPEDFPLQDKNHPIYTCFYDMHRRCFEPICEEYHNYGGRGITVCERWKNNIYAFCEDMAGDFKEGLTLERVNVNGDYSPQNCKWDTRTVQNHNKRKQAGQSSIYKGVTWGKDKGKWQVAITRNRCTTFIGRYSNELAAATAYDNASEEMYGDRPNATVR